MPGAPHETLLVVDATTGQNAVQQARTFQEAVPVTGVVLTKLDGTARGGVLVALRHELGLPIRYVGVGEAVEDLRVFDAGEFVGTLFADEPAGRRVVTFGGPLGDCGAGGRSTTVPAFSPGFRDVATRVPGVNETPLERSN